MFSDLTLEDLGIAEEWHDKVVVVQPEQLEDITFKDPTKYYYLNSFGQRIYLKTRSYTKAKSMVNEIVGKEGFYSVRAV